MATYSDIMDFQGTRFSGIEETHHKEAERYINDMHMYPNNLDPDTHWDSYVIPPLLKRIARLKAKELYAQDSSKAEGDDWSQQAEFAHREIRIIEKKVTRNLLHQTATENTSYPDKGGMPGRLNRC